VGNTLSISIDVTKTSLATLPEKMLDYAQEVLLNQAHVMVGLAQIYVPVDTGSLRDSIRVERGGEGKAWREVRVRAGGYITNPKTGKRVNYSNFVEFGTSRMSAQPFMRPAWEEVKPTILEMLKNNVVERWNK
jgi:HK97 gp10 family phage protein